MNAQDVAAIVVTTGGRDLTPIYESFKPVNFAEVVIWDNSIMPNLRVFGRYAAIYQTKAEWIYVQDDDVVLEPEMIDELVNHYAVEEKVVVNMPEAHRKGEQQALVGWGAIFPWHLPEHSFRKWRRGGGRSDEVFQRTCDIVFTVLTPFERVDLGFGELPWAHEPGRMHLTEGYTEERDAILEQALALRQR